MKTTLDLPDDLMIAVKIRAARENRKLKDVISEALRRDLKLFKVSSRQSVRNIKPMSAGNVIPDKAPEDRLERMLDARGHRY